MLHLNPEILNSVLQSDKKIKKSVFTMRSLATNIDYTFKLTKSEYQGQQYIQLYVEYGYLDFRHLGFYRDGKIIKNGNEVTSKSANGIAWLLRTLSKQDYDKIAKQAEIFHLGKCVCCGRKLTDATSIELGIEPYCRTK